MIDFQVSQKHFLTLNARNFIGNLFSAESCKINIPLYFQKLKQPFRKQTNKKKKKTVRVVMMIDNFS